MRRIIGVLSGVILVAAVSACGGGGPRDVPSDAVAVVGDRSISKADWDALIEQTKENYRATKHPFPKAGSAELASLRSNATQFLVSASEYEQEAAKLGVKVTDEDVQKRLDQIKQQFYASQSPGGKTPSKEAIEKRYQKALKDQGFTDEEVRKGIKITLYRERVQQKVTADITVSDSDIKSYYDKHKQQYETPEQPPSRDVRHILVKKKSRADKLYAQLKSNPKLFPKLAKKYSIDTSSAQAGGTLPGGAVKGRLVKPFERVAFALKVHEISKPVRSQFGWHIIQAMGPVRPAQPAKPTPLSQVKEAIRQTLLQDKRNEASQKWEKKMVDHYCKTIAYAAGYAPAPGQDPCKKQTTTSSSTTSQ
jgi:parvulin-like peptidyl-prolyl isomerase